MKCTDELSKYIYLLKYMDVSTVSRPTFERLTMMLEARKKISQQIKHIIGFVNTFFEVVWNAKHAKRFSSEEKSALCVRKTAEMRFKQKHLGQSKNFRFRHCQISAPTSAVH